MQCLFARGRETELHTNTSIEGWGAILLQRCPSDKLIQSLHYVSRKTTPAQQNYHSFELKTLAVVLAAEKFEIFLRGFFFTIVTDCEAFTQTLNGKELKD